VRQPSPNSSELGSQSDGEHLGTAIGWRAQKRSGVEELRRVADTAPRTGLERRGEPGLQEFAQLRCRLELWDGIEFFECRGERIREAPDGPRPEFLILRLEVKVMNSASKVLGSFEPALHKPLVNDHLRRDVGEFTSLPSLHLLSGLSMCQSQAHHYHADGCRDNGNPE
jgi:hypothetical protein